MSGLRRLLHEQLSLRRLAWTRSLALLAAMPLIALGILQIPQIRQFPGTLLIAVAVIVCYVAGVSVGATAIAEAVAVLELDHVHPAARFTAAGVAIGVVFALVIGAIVSVAHDRDLAGRKAALESEERYRKLLDAAFEAVVLAVDGVVVEANAGVEVLAGVPREELIGRSVFDFIEPGEQEAARRIVEAGEVGPSEFRFLRPDGEIRVVRHIAQNVTYQGRPARLAAMEDITQARLAESERETVEARFRALFDSSAVGVTIAAIDGTYLEANGVFCDLVKRPREEVVGRNFREFSVGDEPATLAAINRGENGPFRFESALLAADGERIPIRATLALVREGEGAPEYTVGVLESIAEQRRLESQLRQTQKMEAIGKLAGGVAHDFNNLLTVIGANVLLLQQQRELTDDAREYAAEIAAAAERAGSLTRQLLAFSRKRELRLRAVDVNRVVRGLDQLLSRLLGPAIEIVLDLTGDDVVAAADLSQLEQVIVNLAVNARDAMPNGGRLTIATERDGGTVVLRVSDTGVGIDEDALDRIFDPFYTTKEAGEGTGLGLSTVYGIVLQFSGEIGVDSVRGEGACFTVRLPVAAGLPEPDAAPDAAPVAAAGPGRVLLVDDEAGIRRVAGKALQRAGHDIVVAENGQQALDLLEREDRIDLLITDLAMPGMNGLELAAAVRERHPDLPVLYISGFSDDVLDSARSNGEQLDVLEKPFSPAALTDRVAQALAKG
jgi:two-component system, cell cycle sensor histidine kinase and response regulator CckA